MMHIFDIAKNDPVALGGLLTSLGSKPDKNQDRILKTMDMAEAAEIMKKVRLSPLDSQVTARSHTQMSGFREEQDVK